MQPEQRHWDAFYRDLKSRSGIDLSLYKQDQIRRRILALMGSDGARDLNEFGSMLARDPQGDSRLLVHLAINVTSMFRNPEKWQVLEEHVLPDLLRRTGAISAWSAGCSLGSEPFSLAALLNERAPGLHRVLATDLDPEALEQAKAAHFLQSQLDAMPRDSLRKQFEACEGGFRPNSVLRRMVTFARHNLLLAPPQRGFDLILCRNVTIYFNEEAKAALNRNFFDALRPGGYLLVGNTERIFDSREIGFESPHTCFYRKPEGGAQSWQHAS